MQVELNYNPDQILQEVEPVRADIENRLMQGIENLNLVNPDAFIGQHFLQILAVMAVMIGGFVLFFGWRHHRYFLGVFGFLIGGWVGLAIKASLVPNGALPPIVYLCCCGAIGCFASLGLYRVMGSLVGGFGALIIGSVLFPSIVHPGTTEYGTILLMVAVGAGFGLAFPTFFYITVSSLIGSSMVVFGLSALVNASNVLPEDPGHRMVLHLAVFLPLLALGILYQTLWEMSHPGGVEGKKETKEIIIRTESGEAVHIA